MITGGGTQIWFGWGCAARVSKPLLIFKGHIGWKRNPFLRIFLKIQAYFSKFLYPKILPLLQKQTIVRDIFGENGTNDFLWISELHDGNWESGLQKCKPRSFQLIFGAKFATLYMIQKKNILINY